MKTRAVSAILAVLVIAVVYYFFHVKGLMVVCAFAALMALREYTRLVFSNPRAPKFLTFAFAAICSATYFGVAHGNESGFLALVFGAVVYLTLGLTVVESKDDLQRV